jgi:hypothetical protein
LSHAFKVSLYEGKSQIAGERKLFEVDAKWCNSKSGIDRSVDFAPIRPQ